MLDLCDKCLSSGVRSFKGFVTNECNCFLHNGYVLMFCVGKNTWKILLCYNSVIQNTVHILEWLHPFFQLLQNSTGRSAMASAWVGVLGCCQIMNVQFTVIRWFSSFAGFRRWICSTFNISSYFQILADEFATRDVGLHDHLRSCLKNFPVSSFGFIL